MCHKCRAEEIKIPGLSVVMPHEIRQEKVEIKQASNVHPMEIFLHSHKAISLFKPEQATVIKPLRNFRSSRSASVLLPTTCLQLPVHKKKTSPLFVSPSSVSLELNYAFREKFPK